jgi:hypothetical protein
MSSQNACRLLHLCLVLLIAPSIARAATWKIETGENKEAPGNKVDFLEEGKLVARFIYGQGQVKPYLHVFARNGDLLTNPGLDKNGKPTGTFPHHRGIFIGWKIQSSLGTDDLWHMTKGCRMEAHKIVRTDVASANQGGSATLVAEVGWHAAKHDETDSDVLLNETRTISLTRFGDEGLLIDTTYVLKPARDLQLVGDLQHSGIHFRAANEVVARAKETSYLYAPDKTVKGSNLKWVRLLFPIGTHWYTAMEMNAPGNPVDELSMRDYGRFGYFFKKPLKKDEPLTLRYRFLVEPATEGKPSDAQLAESRKHCESLYRQFAK